MKAGDLPVSPMAWPRRPNKGLWKPTQQEEEIVIREVVPTTTSVSHFDDPEFDGFDLFEDWVSRASRL